MSFRFSYIISLLFITAKLFCHNIIVNKDSLVKTLKVRDYIKFNLQLGCIINTNNSNAPRVKPEYYKSYNKSYSSHNGNKYNSSINLGFNFVFGRSPKMQHVMGINYLRSSANLNMKIIQ